MEQQNINPNIGGQKGSIAQKIIVVTLWVAILGVAVWLFGFKYPIFKWGGKEPAEQPLQISEYSANGTLLQANGLVLSVRFSKPTPDGKWLIDENKTVRITANTPITKVVEKNYQYTETKLTFRDLKEGMYLAIYSAADPAGVAEITPTRIEVVR